MSLFKKELFSVLKFVFTLRVKTQREDRMVLLYKGGKENRVEASRGDLLLPQLFLPSSSCEIVFSPFLSLVLHPRKWVWSNLNLEVFRMINSWRMNLNPSIRFVKTNIKIRMMTCENWRRNSGNPNYSTADENLPRKPDIFPGITVIVCFGLGNFSAVLWKQVLSYARQLLLLYNGRTGSPSIQLGI